MAPEVDATHDPDRRSWVASANVPGTDFPLQNLPFGVFQPGPGASPRGGVALGEEIIDLTRLLELRLLRDGAVPAAQAAAGASLAPLFVCAPADVSALRAQLSDLFELRGGVDRARAGQCLVQAASVSMQLPLQPPAFTDFCTAIDHIRRMARGAAPLAAMSLPVAYNGRASSVQVSGTPVIRPWGQFEDPPGSGQVRFAPEQLLDFELEVGAWLRGGNALGEPLSVAAADQQVLGCCLVNDWSARGIQFFESILGPHLGKSFLTTISPWIVTREALAPFRVAARGRDSSEPAVPAHLSDAMDRSTGALQVELTAELRTAAGASLCVTRSHLAELYWTLAQMVAHQASNGTPLQAGDLIATGTVSGAAEQARGCLAEITLRGGSLLELPNGTTRTMLDDGDTLTLRGVAHADGFVPIGFGVCSGTIHPARSAS